MITSVLSVFRNNRVLLALAVALFSLGPASYLSPLARILAQSGYHLSLHTMLEFSCVFLSFAIFSIVWFVRDALDDTQGRFILFLGTSFLLVGWVNLLHALSYQGMPDFITPSSIQKATVLHLSARLLAALSLLAALAWAKCPLCSHRQLAVKLIFLDAVLAIAALAMATKGLWLVPPLYTETHGLTGFKIGCEYFIIVLYALAFWLLYKNRSHIKENVLINLGYFIILTICSEITFTIYADVYDVWNLVGHVYKLLAEYFLFRAVCWSGVVNYFYTLSEMAEMSAALLKEKISLEPVMNIQMEKLRQIMPHAERIVVYVVNGGDACRTSFVWGKFSNILGAGRDLKIKGFLESSGAEIRIFDAPLDILECIGDPNKPPEVPVELVRILRAARQVLCIPLSLPPEGKTFGMILIYIFSPLHQFSADDIEKAAVFQKFATLAITQAKSQETITRLSFEDSLTGLPNRRFFFAELEQTLAGAGEARPFTVVYLDMNGLKFINDNLGHAAGDAALRLIGRCLLAMASAEVLPARLGGDEFALLYRDLGLPEAEAEIERLKAGFGALDLAEYGHRFSLAVGGATYPDETTDISLLLKLADDRMYAHKQQMKTKTKQE